RVDLPLQLPAQGLLDTGQRTQCQRETRLSDALLDRRLSRQVFLRGGEVERCLSVSAILDETLAARVELGELVALRLDALFDGLVLLLHPSQLAAQLRQDVGRGEQPFALVVELGDLPRRCLPVDV